MIFIKWVVVVARRKIFSEIVLEITFCHTAHHRGNGQFWQREKRTALTGTASEKQSSLVRGTQNKKAVIYWDIEIMIAHN